MDKDLLNTIDDPLVLDQKKYLTPDQQSALDAFLKAKKLPEKIDNFFMGAIERCCRGLSL
jgi:hypothetical protein